MWTGTSPRSPTRSSPPSWTGSSKRRWPGSCPRRPRRTAAGRGTNATPPSTTGRWGSPAPAAPPAGVVLGGSPGPTTATVAAGLGRARRAVGQRPRPTPCARQGQRPARRSDRRKQGRDGDHITRTRGRTHLHLPDRALVPATPPPQDPRRLALPRPGARVVPVDQPPPLPIPPRPHRTLDVSRDRHRCRPLDPPDGCPRPATAHARRLPAAHPARRQRNHSSPPSGRRVVAATVRPLDCCIITGASPPGPARSKVTVTEPVAGLVVHHHVSVAAQRQAVSVP